MVAASNFSGLGFLGTIPKNLPRALGLMSKDIWMTHNYFLWYYFF